MTTAPHPLIVALTTEPAGDEAANPAVEHVLDAAFAQFVDVGIRRSTIEDIARRAGIDRVTVYRRIGSKDDVIRAVIAREARRLIREVTRASADVATFDERVAVGFTTAIQYVRANALYQRVVALEADSILPGITTDAGPLLSVGVAAAAGLIQQAQDDGLIGPVSEPEAVAELLVRIVQSYVLTPQAVLTLRTDADLAGLARRHLAPIISRHSQPPPTAS